MLCSATTSRGTRCQNQGHGRPPLCHIHDGHDDEDGAWAERVLDSPRGTRVMGIVNKFADRLINRFERAVDRSLGPNEDDIEATEGSDNGKQSWILSCRLCKRRLGVVTEKGGLEAKRLLGEHTLSCGGQAFGGQAPPTSSDDPRAVMGFEPHAKLTVEAINKRQKDLAKVLHPDAGGANAAMARVNAAADALRKECS